MDILTITQRTIERLRTSEWLLKLSKKRYEAMGVPGGLLDSVGLTTAPGLLQQCAACIITTGAEIEGKCLQRT